MERYMLVYIKLVSGRGRTTMERYMLVYIKLVSDGCKGSPSVVSIGVEEGKNTRGGVNHVDMGDGGFDAKGIVAILANDKP